MDLESILIAGVKASASDIHLVPNQPPLFRINGNLKPVENTAPLPPEIIKQLLFGTLTPLQQNQLTTELEIDFGLTLPAIARFRVNAFTQKSGIAAVFRIIPEKIPTLDELQSPLIFKNMLDLPNGLILVTGPTGSGKSTTLAAMVDYIDSHQACHIITIEDPIEFSHNCKQSIVNQREVHNNTKDFSVALRSALREDPDVILVGEMRDLETIRLALTAAETGHLVMGTLHTSSAPRTINRIIDVFPTGEKNTIRNMLSESLQAVICQTLVKKLDGGRVAAYEIMVGTPAIRNLIREDKVAQMMTTMQTNSAAGMFTMDQYLQTLVSRKVISLEVAKEAALDKSHFTGLNN